LASKEVVDHLIAARVEQELASDNEGSAERPRHSGRDMLIARLEKSANTCHRASNEQVRNLTELLLTLARSVQGTENNGQRAYISPNTGRRDNFEQRSGSIRRSHTLGTHQSRINLASLESASNQTVPDHPSATKPLPEDVLEALPRFGHERMQSEPLSDAHSPRTLRRAKSSVSAYS
jgi:hypothetical protein